MKTAFLALVILGLSGAYLEAIQCPYFRVATNLLKCVVADDKKTNQHNPYATSQELPELEVPDAQALIEVTCDCSYSLMGSDPRCDFEQTMERTSTVGVSKPSEACRRGRSLCKEVCPPRLP